MIAVLKALFGFSGEQIGPQEAVRRMNAGAVLVDVRERNEFSSGHAVHAKHLPMAQARAGHAALFDSLKLPSDTCEVLLICQSGMRSRMAQGQLSGAATCRYVNVSGGMNAWLSAGLPIIRGATHR